jgi:hypothetical protein
MHSDDFVAGLERDAILVDALYRAIYAMKLTNGCQITLAGMNGRLHYDYEIGKLKRALYLLGVDMAESFPAPVGGCKPI